jgi:hypothetical protein
MQHNLEEDFSTLRALLKSSHWHTNTQCRMSIWFFSMHDGSTANLDIAQADAHSDGGYSAGIGRDPAVDEAPADMDDAEPLQEDRVVPFSGDSETALADGILMTENCTLKVLRAGCSVLGLSSRGGKNTCLKRMVEHVRARWCRNQNAQ